jgi:hypothetical protein
VRPNSPSPCAANWTSRSSSSMMARRTALKMYAAPLTPACRPAVPPGRLDHPFERWSRSSRRCTAPIVSC